MSVRDRYAQCDETCTVDCGACKGAGRPTPPSAAVPDPAKVEKAARAIWEAADGYMAGVPWERATAYRQEKARRQAAAALAAVRPSPADGVDPAEIVRQRSLGWPDFHPEDYCHQCGRPNPTWFADTEEWQTATGSTGDGGGILCPSCFAALWEAKTGKTAIIWRLSIDPRSRALREDGAR